MRSKAMIAAALGLAATAAFGQGQNTETPGIRAERPLETSRPPVVWGAMDAFDLNRRLWRSAGPAVTLDQSLVEQRARERSAALDRMRARYAGRLHETHKAQAGPEGASVGAGTK